MSPVQTFYDEWGAAVQTEWLDGATRRVTRFGYDGLGRLTERRLLAIQSNGVESPESTDFYYYDEHSGVTRHAC